MTAIRNFPNAPLRQQAAASWRWQTPAWLLSVWQGLQRHGQQRAAWELELLAAHRGASDPQLARQFRAAAAECRRAAAPASTRSRP